MLPRIFIPVTVILYVLTFVKGSVKPCQRVRPTFNKLSLVNCSVVCSSHLLHYITESEEMLLCFHDSTAIFCDKNEDCRRYYAGSVCKKIPCACEGPSGSGFYYVVDPKSHNQIPGLRTCTISAKWLDPEQSFMPFPWKTLLVVLGIVASFTVFLVVVRWVSPFIRAMQAKSIRDRNRSSSQQEDEPFTSIPLQDGTRQSTRAIQVARVNAAQRLQTHRRNLHNQCMSTLLQNPTDFDKPPPYEVAIQELPRYESVEELEPLQESESTTNREETLPKDRHNSASVGTV